VTSPYVVSGFNRTLANVVSGFNGTGHQASVSRKTQQKRDAITH
jgi:hypothetical protein